jgi:hypothetical protein
MRDNQCWAIAADGLRCAAPSTFGDYFCIVHGFGTRPEPDQIWREPVCEMPPGLVVLIRAEDPDAVFPEPAPEPDVSIPAAPAPAVPLEPAALAPEPAPAAPTEADPAPLAWLLAAVREAIEHVMAGEATPLQKANAVSRLGSLYLKTYRAAELQQENRRLKEQVAALEAHLAAAEAEAASHEPRPVTPAAPRHGIPSPAPRPIAEGHVTASPLDAAAHQAVRPARRRSRKR